MNADEFNAAYPVGTPVLAYPGIRPDDPVAITYRERAKAGRTFGSPDPCKRLETRTRSVAWELGCGEPVVMVDGYAGGIALTHIDPIDQGAASVPRRPHRIQRRRVKGWRAPAGAVYVGRGTRYGNPYRIVREDNLWIVRVDPADGVRGQTIGDYTSRHHAHQVAVEEFRTMLRSPGGAEQAQYFAERLHGRDLMCWCPESLPCHADVLLAISNPQPATT